jgi:hypothetical protein
MTRATPVCHDDVFNRDAVRNARAVDDALRELAPVVKLTRENITILARHEHVSEGAPRLAGVLVENRVPGTTRTRCDPKSC